MWEQFASLDFATVKAVCAGTGLVIFLGVFVVATVWVYRPGAGKYYQDTARRILNDE